MGKISFLFSVAFFFVFCEDKTDHNPAAAQPQCYGDTLCADLSYAERNQNGVRVVDFTVTLTNKTSRTLAVDSTQKGTFIEIFHADSTASEVWVSPAAWGTDTATHSVALAPGGKFLYADTWQRTNRLGYYVPPGAYSVKAKILSHYTNEILYTEL